MHEDESDPTTPAPPPDILPKAQWLARAKIGKTTYDESYRAGLEARGRVWEDVNGAHWMSAADADAIRASRFRVSTGRSRRAERARRPCPNCGERMASVARACPSCTVRLRPDERRRTAG